MFIIMLLNPIIIRIMPFIILYLVCLFLQRQFYSNSLEVFFSPGMIVYENELIQASLSNESLI